MWIRLGLFGGAKGGRQKLLSGDLQTHMVLIPGTTISLLSYIISLILVNPRPVSC